MTTTNTTKSGIRESADKEGPSKNSIKTVHFAPTVSTSMVKTMSVAPFVSVHGDEPHNAQPTSTEAAVFGCCGNAE